MIRIKIDNCPKYIVDIVESYEWNYITGVLISILMYISWISITVMKAWNRYGYPVGANHYETFLSASASISFSSFYVWEEKRYFDCLTLYSVNLRSDRRNYARYYSVTSYSLGAAEFLLVQMTMIGLRETRKPLTVLYLLLPYFLGYTLFMFLTARSRDPTDAKCLPGLCCYAKSLAERVPNPKGTRPGTEPPSIKFHSNPLNILITPSLSLNSAQYNQ